MKRLLLVTSLLLALSGCFTVEAALPGTLRNDIKADQTEVVGKVNIEKTNWFFLWGLVGAPPADFFSAEIKSQVGSKGDGVARLTYESQTGCVDLLVGGLTLGCVGPRTYKVTGDIVKIKSAPLPGKKAAELKETTEPNRVAQAY